MSAKPCKITVIPTKLSGRADEDPFKYLQKFPLASTANNWNDDIKIKTIPNYLQDGALLWFHNYVRDKNAAAFWLWELL